MGFLELVSRNLTVEGSALDRQNIGMISSSFDSIVSIVPQDEWSKEQLIEDLERRGAANLIQ